MSDEAIGTLRNRQQPQAPGNLNPMIGMTCLGKRQAAQAINWINRNPVKPKPKVPVRC